MDQACRSQFGLACLFTSFAVVLAGCQALVEAMEMSAPYPTPPKQLNSDPGSTGLIVVKSDIHVPFNDLGLAGATLERSQPAPVVIRLGSIRSDTFGGFDGPVVFGDLSPGHYQLVQLRGENLNAYAIVPLPRTAEYEVDLEAGDIVYIGTIKARSEIGGKTSTTLSYEPDVEIKAWRSFIKRYPTSPWVPMIEDRIREVSK